MSHLAKRLAALAAMTALVVGACGSAATPSPSAASAAPPSGSSAASPSSAGSPSAATAACPVPPTASLTLTGAGATFPAPLYNVWFEKYTEKYANIQFNYQSNGSGGGVTQITQQTVDFGASDAALKDAEIAALPAGTKILHVPTALGAVVVIFNLPGRGQAPARQPNIADIFLGTITKWNDPKIAANNAGVNLPDEAILVVHRSDGSGTTNAFTTYLDTVSPDWHTQGRQGQGGQVADGPGRPGQRRRRRRRQADRGCRRLRRAQLRDAGQARLGHRQERRRPVRRRVDRRRDRGGRRGRGSFPADFRQAADHQRRRRGHLPDRLVHLPARLPGPRRTRTRARPSSPSCCWALTDGQATREGPRLSRRSRPRSSQKALAELHTVHGRRDAHLALTAVTRDPTRIPDDARCDPSGPPWRPISLRTLEVPTTA